MVRECSDVALLNVVTRPKEIFPCEILRQTTPGGVVVRYQTKQSSNVIIRIRFDYYHSLVILLSILFLSVIIVTAHTQQNSGYSHDKIPISAPIEQSLYVRSTAQSKNEAPTLEQNKPIGRDL